MQGLNTDSFKQAFLKNLLLCLHDQPRTSTTTLFQRKRAVRSSADVAMAAARGAGSARWPNAILAAAASSSTKASICRRYSSVLRRHSNGSWRRGIAVARRRTTMLREVIPGGRDAVDEAALLREAMDYLVHLRAQVDVLRRLSEAATLLISSSADDRYAAAGGGD